MPSRPGTGGEPRRKTTSAWTTSTLGSAFPVCSRQLACNLFQGIRTALVCPDVTDGQCHRQDDERDDEHQIAHHKSDRAHVPHAPCWRQRGLTPCPTDAARPRQGRGKHSLAAQPRRMALGKKAVSDLVRRAARCHAVEPAGDVFAQAAAGSTTSAKAKGSIERRWNSPSTERRDGASCRSVKELAPRGMRAALDREAGSASQRTIDGDLHRRAPRRQMDRSRRWSSAPGDGASRIEPHDVAPASALPGSGPVARAATESRRSLACRSVRYGAFAAPVAGNSFCRRKV
jgi:hypothetical protein